jgi:hypothetical protein
MSRRLLIGLQCALLLLATTRVSAVDLEWNKTSGFLFYNTAGNWTPNQTPTVSDNVTFDLDATYSVILGAPSLGLNLNLLDGDVLFNSGGGATLSTSGIATVDDAAAAALATGRS